VGERIHLLSPFRWKLTEVPFGLDHPYWIQDPDLDLDFHIRETAVPPPGGPEQLATPVARILSRPLDQGHPLWEATGSTTPGRSSRRSSGRHRELGEAVCGKREKARASG